MEPLEIHIPASPNAQFLTQVLYFAASRLFYGGPLASAKIVVQVGDSGPRVDLAKGLRWPESLNIEWRWVRQDLLNRYSYHATAFERFRQDFDAKYVLMADADMLMTAPIVDLLRVLDDAPAIAGAMAHCSPFKPELQHSHNAWWELLFSKAALPKPTFAYPYSGWGIYDTDISARLAPAYFNFGFVLAPAEMMSAIGDEVYHDLDVVNDTLPTFFRCQIALAMTIARLQLPVHLLAPRYNFPNNQAMAEAYPDDLQDVRMLHYHNTTEIDKKRDFGSPVAVHTMLQRPGLSSVNTLLQERCLPVHQALQSLMAARQHIDQASA